MEVENLDTWEEFEQRIHMIRLEREQQVETVEPISVSGALFRGQADSSWDLASTLQRRRDGRWSMLEYYRLVYSIRPQVEAYTGVNWDVERFGQLQEWTSNYDSIRTGAPPAYEYLTYLRHHGFPSPLLDWSQSPYVAAYFAFAQPRGERVAIYVYMEHFGYGKIGGSDRPQILTIGPTIKSHTRHFLQRSEYSMALFFDEGSWFFHSHDDVFAEASDRQDRLWKITLPASERVKVLGRLDDHNLNAHSLFQSTDALLETISIRELDLSQSFGPTISG